MRFVCAWCVMLTLGTTSVKASEPRVYRCDNSIYTNLPNPTQRCVPLSGGHITVIEGTRVNGVANAPALGAATAVKVDTQEQKQRDAQAVVVLQAELHKAQSRHAELLKEWNQGEPERHAIEVKQPAKYQERVTQLRLALQRSEADVVGLQRELNRLNSAASGGKP